MRRAMMAVAAAGALLIGYAGPAWADPPDPVPAGSLAPGWSIDGGTLSWTAPKRIPMGDAAIEFYAGDRLLGHPRVTPDQRTFRLNLGRATRLDDLQVRAGGRRLDAAAPKTLATAPPPVVPAAAPANAVDPGTKGPYRTVTGEYSLPGVKLSTGEQAEPSRPLSATGLIPYVVIPPGETAVDLQVPTVADGVAEPAEQVRFQALVFPSDFGGPIPVTVIDGTVSD